MFRDTKYIKKQRQGGAIGMFRQTSKNTNVFFYRTSWARAPLTPPLEGGGLLYIDLEVLYLDLEALYLDLEVLLQPKVVVYYVKRVYVSGRPAVRPCVRASRSVTLLRWSKKMMMDKQKLCFGGFLCALSSFSTLFSRNSVATIAI